MAAAAVSCSLKMRGCLNVQSVSAVSGAAVSSSSGKCFAFYPLHTRHAMLRSSTSAYLSSSLAASTSFALRRKFTETQRSSRLRLAAPRASRRDEEETEQITKLESEDRLQANVNIASETSQNMWSQFLTSAAKPAVVAMMMALLLAQPIEDSLAASSGGRMGGKSFSAPSRPSAPSRSYSGGGGGGRAYSGGGGLNVAPPIYGSPYGFSPFGYSPFYGGGYGGGLFLGPSIGFGGGGTIILAMIAFATLRAVVGFIGDRFRGDDDDRFDD